MEDFNQTAVAVALLATMGTMVLVGIYLVIRTSRLTTKQAEKLIAEGKMSPRKSRIRRKEKMPPSHLTGGGGDVERNDDDGGLFDGAGSDGAGSGGAGSGGASSGGGGGD